MPVNAYPLLCKAASEGLRAVADKLEDCSSPSALAAELEKISLSYHVLASFMNEWALAEKKNKAAAESAAA